jgi:hypothetical protein
MGTLTEIGDFLIAAGVVAGDSGDTEPRLYLDHLGDYPNQALCVYGYPGGPPEYVQNSYAPIAEKPQIQIVARALDHDEAEDLAWAAWHALSPITNATLGSTYYRSIRPNASPALMRKDTNDRFLFFFNASVDKEVPVAAAS